MKRFWVWLLLEYKRAVKILPFVLAEAMVLMCIIGTIAFCTQKAAERREDGGEKPIIALVAEEENGFITMAVSYMEGMQSVESLCRFEHVNFEQGMRMLQSREVIAMVVLPDNMIEGILNGTNQPAALYLPDKMTAAGQVFEALADAGIGMLQTAQAEIYAINDIGVEYGRTDSISDMEYDINIFNVNLAFNREKIFKMRSLSVTENLSFVSYYCSAGMVLYLLLAGLAFCVYFEKENIDCERQLEAAGVSAPKQLAGKVMVVASLLFISSLIPLLIYMVLWNRGILTLYFSPETILGAVLCILCTAVLQVFCYRMAGNVKAALLWIGVGSIVLCFLSGVFVPSALLPAGMRQVAGFLPSSWMKQLWLVWFREGNIPWPVMGKTAAFSIGLFVITCLLSQRRRTGKA